MRARCVARSRNPRHRGTGEMNRTSSARGFTGPWPRVPAASPSRALAGLPSFFLPCPAWAGGAGPHDLTRFRMRLFQPPRRAFEHGAEKHTQTQLIAIAHHFINVVKNEPVRSWIVI